MPTAVDLVAAVCLVWSSVVVVVEALGISAIFRFFSNKPATPVSPTLGPDTPAVTVIRPVKGLEPHLYECIASTFLQGYPSEKLQIRLCVEDKSDSALPILEQVVKDFPNFDAKVLVENEDASTTKNLGPNPKIRNISRAYREANADIIWVVDCNVWVPKGVLGRMVDRLMGYKPGNKTVQPYKFVHQMPLVVDIVDYERDQPMDGQTLLSSASEASPQTDLVTPEGSQGLARVRAQGGGRLDEMFMATTHAKFYGAINAVGVAPCVVGKSNMFRKSQLNMATTPSENPILARNETRPPGVDFFSHNICEDHSIGDILWRTNIPGYKNHGIVWGNLVVQPMAGMSVRAYAARRVRWLRARKWTVLAATLVEPGVESMLCGLYFTFAVTNLSWFEENLGIPQTWSAMGSLWLLFVTAWMLADWTVYCRLHSARSIEMDENTPYFAKGRSGPRAVTKRRFTEWVLAWIGREVMALPIWTWAVLLGKTVNWRGKSFLVRSDTTVVEIEPKKSQSRASKNRKD